jgi:hypothetical protein
LSYPNHKSDTAWHTQVGWPPQNHWLTSFRCIKT